MACGGIRWIGVAAQLAFVASSLRTKVPGSASGLAVDARLRNLVPPRIARLTGGRTQYCRIQSGRPHKRSIRTLDLSVICTELLYVSLIRTNSLPPRTRKQCENDLDCADTIACLV